MNTSKSINDIQFFAESSFDSVMAAMGVMTHSSAKTASNNHCICQKEDDYTQHQCFGINNVINGDEEKCNVKVTNNSWTRKQWLILITSILGNFGCAVCVSLQAPFFPAEATRKGVSATLYGFVFSAFSLTVFVLAPIFGKYIAKIGPRFLMNSGIFVTSICCILFGLLNKINSTTTFVTLAFFVRIVEGMGDAAYHTANFATMAATFPGDIGKTFAFLRAAFGVGLIAGPTIGGPLYQLGGYPLPFAFMGSILLVLSICSTILFWDQSDDMLSTQPNPSILKALRIPSVSLSMTAVCLSALTIGFLAATLEPHLRQFNLSPVEVGLVFVISGGVYAATSIFWGWLCDRRVPPKILIVIGACLLSTMCILIGPAPFLPLQSSLELCIVALVFHGLGLGAEMLPSHVDAVKQAMLNGFPDSYQTYGIISGVWAAFFQLGNFLGPSIGGVLYDTIGFRQSTMFILALQILLLVCNLVYYLVFEHNVLEIRIASDKTPLLH